LMKLCKTAIEHVHNFSLESIDFDLVRV
jgi:hypothetical protein